MSLRLRFLACCVFLGTAALQAQDIDGSKDHPLITRYPGSIITQYSQKAFDSYELPLGQGSVQDSKPEKSQHLEGKVTMLEYALPEGRSPLEVYRNYEAALRRAGFVPQFSCTGNQGPLSCGWLAQYLHDGLGTGSGGPDVEQQRFLAARLARPEGDVFVALHVGPEDAILDVVEVKPMEGGLITVDAAALAGDLGRSGHTAVYGIYFDTGKWDVKPESDAALKEIAKLLQQNPALRLHVVGHTDNVGELAANLELSRKRAAAVVQTLTTKHGVATPRLHPEGVGPLSPVASNDTPEGRGRNRRVELVKQ